MEPTETLAVADGNAGRQVGGRMPGLMATGGMLAAVAASSCCVLPLALFLLGASGPWLGRLTALSPYQPLFVTAAFSFLGYGFWLVYLKPRKACADGAACKQPVSAKITKIGLWVATVLVVAAATFDYTAPALLSVL